MHQSQETSLRGMLIGSRGGLEGGSTRAGRLDSDAGGRSLSPSPTATPRVSPLIFGTKIPCKISPCQVSQSRVRQACGGPIKC
eukprot:1187622-Prorocentrum_minimum.AAC.5